MRVFCGCAARGGLTRVAWLMTAGLAVALGGCGESNALSGAKLYPVKGKVLLPDGKPLTAGHVIFVGSKLMVTSSATIESDGSFTFKDTSGGGLPEDNYKIRIEGGTAPGAKASTDRSKPSLPFANQFLDEDASGLTATVTSEDAKNDFELKLTPTKTESAGKAGRGDR
jgi:hypothetical protein